MFSYSVLEKKIFLALLTRVCKVTQEDVALTVEHNYGMFVPVEYATNTYSYGGDQGWYDTTTTIEGAKDRPIDGYKSWYYDDFKTKAVPVKP